MKNNFFLKIIFIFLFLISMNSNVYSNVIKKIEVYGNDRISDTTISMFSGIDINDIINDQVSNSILNNLYETGFFENINLTYENEVLKIYVEENPLINNLIIKGIKAKKIRKQISDSLTLKARNSFNEDKLFQDKKNIIISLKKIGYYFPTIDIKIVDLGDKKIDLIYDINLGEKSKIKKISFVGNKIFKDRKLRRLIVTEEFKFWKFITGRKYLNEDTINLDKRLLKNYYLNKGYYNVEINSTFAKLLKQNQFELIFNIDAKNKIYFDEILLNLPVDFNKNNFDDLYNLFDEIKGQPYSIFTVEKILSEIENISTNEEYFSIDAKMDEQIIDDKINIEFKIQELEKTFVEKINIFGNNVTRESVIRNQFLVDEGDPYNVILANKSLNNIKSLNFFKSVRSETIDGSNPNLKIINYYVEEKPTGEITAGAGVGTGGGTIAFGVKENNYLGKGINLDLAAVIDSESANGNFTVINPNFKNSDKSIILNVNADETDRLTSAGYKTNKLGFSLGTNFEYLNDLKLGLNTSNYFERIETGPKASSLQKKQAGNFYDSFIVLDLDYDKRNQKFKTSDGFRSSYTINLPVISDTNTLTNIYKYKYFDELYENNVTSFAFSFKAAKSLNNKDIKLTERLFLSSRELRGFERGKVGPKDGNDYIGGNYVSSLNFSSTLPQILSNLDNLETLMFFDAANIWGVDYDSSINDNSEIRSSVGIGIDWFTPIGPINFSLAHPITKAKTDKTESFRFNLGTTF